METFDEWFNGENQQLEEGYWSPICEGGKTAVEAAFKAGMLAAADIAESDLSDDNDYNETCEWIAEEIRGKANES